MAFKLRSGNTTAFKSMGSSPAKDTGPHTGMNPPHNPHKKEKKETIVDKVVDFHKRGVEKIVDLVTPKKRTIPVFTDKDGDPIIKESKPNMPNQYQEEKVTDFTPPDLGDIKVDIPKKKKEKKKKKKVEAIKLPVKQPKLTEDLMPKKKEKKEKKKEEVTDTSPTPGDKSGRF